MLELAWNETTEIISKITKQQIFLLFLFTFFIQQNDKYAIKNLIFNYKKFAKNSGQETQEK